MTAQCFAPAANRRRSPAVRYWGRRRAQRAHTRAPHAPNAVLDAPPPRAVRARSPSTVRLVLAEVEGGREVAGLRVAIGQCWQAPAVLDQLEDRGCVVLGVVHKALLCERRDDDGRHAQTGAPFVD